MEKIERRSVDYNFKVGKNTLIIISIVFILISSGIFKTFASDGYFQKTKMSISHVCLQEESNSETTIQQIPITGVVTDASNGNPIPGVNVQIKGTTIGVTTDSNGKFLINVSDRTGILIFSFIGYMKQEVPLNGRTRVNVSMSPELVNLDEVVVVGYGTQKKVNLTGAVGITTSESLENRPIVSAGQGLQGVIPNLNITFRNGDPNTLADFNVRGYESINGGSPLILIDGIPMSLDRINPQDIQSISVLKDASAAAIYGARAAFGVILVETKKGGKDKINVMLNAEPALSMPIWKIDLVQDPYEYARIRNIMLTRTTGKPAYTDFYMEKYKKWSENPIPENEWGVTNGVVEYYGNNDYSKRIVSKASPQQKYDLSIAGSTDKSSYYVSLGYFKKDGYINEKYLKNKNANEVFKRYNILMKAEYKPTNWLSLEEKISFTNQSNDAPHFYNWDVNINSVVRTNPMKALQFPDLEYYLKPGDHDQFAPYIGMYSTGANWLEYLEHGGRTTYDLEDIWLTQGITITPLKGLRLRGDFSYNSYRKNYQDVSNKVEVIEFQLTKVPLVNNGFSADDFIKNENDRNTYFVLNAYAEYTMDQFKDHYFKALAGFNQEWGTYEWMMAYAKGLVTPTVWNLNATTGKQSVDGSKSQLALRGAFYRLNYIYKDRYLVEINGRYDGTSRFPQNNRFGFFPSFSLGWRISNESFMAGTKGWLDNLKLRASYGQLGNQSVGSYYPYIASMSVGTTPFQFSSGTSQYVAAEGIVSPDLTWERVISKNIGLDITLLKGNLDFSVDAYIRDTKDMLMNVKYPDVLGTPAPKSNAAELRTKGWEASINYRKTIGKDWHLGLNMSLSDNTTEITRYDNPSGSLSEYYVGMKIGEIWGYVTEGIFQTDDEVAKHADQTQLGANWKAGDMKIADLNNDKKITAGKLTLNDPGDRRIIGNSTPRYAFGIMPKLGYKNWSLNAFFQGLFRDYLPLASNWTLFYPGVTGVVETWYEKESWTPDNPDAYYPALHRANSNLKNYTPQSRWVQNASYIRLKNLTLSYTIPEQKSNKVGLSNAEIYLSGMNLWEFSKIHRPLDPENVTTVTQEYWMQRIYAIGIKLSF